MSRLTPVLFLLVMALAIGLGLPRPASAQTDELLRKLNDQIDRTSAEGKSFRLLFDAYLDMTPAPSTTGKATREFNLSTIHPRMSNWQDVSNWAESNTIMAEAILRSRNRVMFGLPYGERGLDQAYLSHGLAARVAIDGNLRQHDFAYLSAIDTIAAYVTAECYRLLEANNSVRAVDLAIASVFVFAQITDRRFYDEKLHGMRLLTSFLEVVRDLMWVYRDTISMEQFRRFPYEEGSGSSGQKQGIAGELPFVRTDLIQLPDGDQIMAEALVEQVFAGRDTADPEMFSLMFTGIQSEGQPFTRFGAARRWQMIAMIHSSRQATLKQLDDVYQDWVRRWHIRDYDPLHDYRTQYDRTNPIRYAAVIASMRDIQAVFEARRLLRAAINATTVSAGVCAYYKQFNTFPDDVKKTYAQFVLKRHDLDPYDRDAAGFGYRHTRSAVKILTSDHGFVEVRDLIVWSKGRDHTSQLGQEHRSDGAQADIVYWPPLRALAREQGLAR